MQHYTVTGMSCAACSARVEKVVGAVPGVTAVSVSLLTNSMQVEGTAASSDIIAAVTGAGYGAGLKDAVENSGTGKPPKADDFTDRETPKMIRRLVASLIFLLPLLYVSMGHMMWNWPVPEFLSENQVSTGIYEMLLAGIVMVINQKFFASGFKGLIHRAPNMDTLVALGSMASFLYSTYVLFRLSDAVGSQNAALVSKYSGSYYFESAAMILTLITVGKTLETYSKGKTTSALKGLMELAPETANVIRPKACGDGACGVGEEEVTVPLSEVRVGDIFVVRPGERIPTDGEVLEGSSAVDESALTGESIPVDKEAGSPVKSATVNRSGFLRCRATKVGEDTTLSQIISMVNDAAATKAPIAKIADKVSGIFVPTVIGISIVTFIGWMLTGKTFEFSLLRAVSVLVISCPCALGLATPVAIMVGNGVGAKNGILFKNAESLELTGRVKTVALDKTGTVTNGKPAVTDILPAEGVSEKELVTTAFALEAKSEHPLAKAVCEYAKELGFSESAALTEFLAAPGNGLSGILSGVPVSGGNRSFMEKSGISVSGVSNRAEELAKTGKTPLYFAKEGKCLGLIAVSDSVRKDSAKAIAEMKELGLKVVMLTGDNPETAAAIGNEAGVTEVFAGLLPEQKESIVRKLSEEGSTAMVGDGINDAPALTRADIGIAIGAGTDIAIDAADVVLVKSSLADAAAAVRLSRHVIRNIHENLFWAFFYNVIGIPIAAGLLYPVCGLELSPMLGAAAMSLSSFCVVSNALRLNRVKLGNGRKQKAEPSENAAFSKPQSEDHNEVKASVNDINTKEEAVMEKTILIKGMMCPHCEAHVKEALEKIDGIESAAPSHTEANAVLTLSREIPEDVLKKAVTDCGYEYLGTK